MGPKKKKEDAKSMVGQPEKNKPLRKPRSLVWGRKRGHGSKRKVFGPRNKKKNKNRKKCQRRPEGGIQKGATQKKWGGSVINPHLGSVGTN